MEVSKTLLDMLQNSASRDDHAHKKKRVVLPVINDELGQYPLFSAEFRRFSPVTVLKGGTCVTKRVLNQAKVSCTGIGSKKKSRLLFVSRFLPTLSYSQHFPLICRKGVIVTTFFFWPTGLCVAVQARRTVCAKKNKIMISTSTAPNFSETLSPTAMDTVAGPCNHSGLDLRHETVYEKISVHRLRLSSMYIKSIYVTNG